MRKFYLLLIVFCFLAAGAHAHSWSFYPGRAGINSFMANDIRVNDSGKDDIKAGALFACDAPTALNTGSITATTASVSFTSAGTSFIVEYGPTGFTPGIGAAPGPAGTIVTGAASPIGLTGLTAGSTYQVYVRRNCGGVDGFSINTGPVSFNTNCTAATLPYLENFDGATVPALPLCMTVQNVNADNTWETVVTDDNVSSPNIARLAWEDDLVTPANDWFFTKGLNLTAGTSYRLKFNYRNSDALDYIEKLEVKYGSAANAASMGSGTLFTNTNINFNTWLEKIVDFTPSVTGVYYIGFHGFSDANQAYLAIDDISVDVTPPCFPPTGVTISNLTPIAATVNFSSPGTNFIIEYGLTGFTPGTGAIAGPLGTAIAITSSQLPYTLSGLATLTTYDVYIRQICNAVVYGPNTTATTFTTPLPNDEAPGAITITVDAACSGNGYTNSGSTQSVSEKFASCSGTAGYHSVWYKFTAPAGGAVKISTDFSGSGLGDSRMAVFSASNVNDYNTFTILGCDDNNGVISATKSVLYLADLVPSNIYYIQVDGLNSSTVQGTFCLEVSSLTTSMIAGSALCGVSKGFTGLNASYNGWISLVDNSGKLIANVKQTAGTATSITANVNVNTGSVRQDPASLQKYLDRNYRITATGATSANIQFFFPASELTALQTADTAVTLSKIGITRQTGDACNGNFLASNGTNTYLAQTGNGTLNNVNWVNVTTSAFSNFYLHTSKSPVTLKTFLQGAYAGAGAHKAVTTVWRDVLRNNARSQPYNTAAFGNYNGGENVPALTFNNTTSTDILDWVLLELRSAAPPAAAIATRAAFIREDGAIVDLDGVSSVSFRGVPNGSYYITIRHRNHLAIRTATLLVLDGALGSNPAPTLYNLSTAQTQAFQNGTILTNGAMKDLGGGVFGLFAGNANSNTQSRASGAPTQNDYLFLVNTALGGNPGIVLSNVYHSADMNMDGVVRASGAPTQNDYLYLVNTILGGNPGITYNQHQ